MQHSVLQFVGLFSCIPFRERTYFSSTVHFKSPIKSLSVVLICCMFPHPLDKQAVTIYCLTVVTYCSILIFYFVDLIHRSTFRHPHGAGTVDISPAKGERTQRYLVETKALQKCQQAKGKECMINEECNHRDNW